MYDFLSVIDSRLTMGLLHTVSNINSNFAQKSEFPTPCVFNPPGDGIFVTAVALKNNCVMPDGGKSLTTCAFV